jgi:hypothetical protein
MAIDIAGGKPPFAMVKTVGTSNSRPAQTPLSFDKKPFFSSSFAADPVFPPSLAFGAFPVGLSLSGVVVLDSMIGRDRVDVITALKVAPDENEQVLRTK